jgi:16S rRNA (adenine1518-N6/adenine1519-N6)-dimethyltransferase
MLRVSLKQLVNDLSSVSDHPFMTLRPEQLTIPQFVELTNLVEKLLPSQDGKLEK